jgi:hypothetical protein
MPVGGRQLIGIQTMVGGGLCLDAMGPVENSIAWRGIFTGPNRSVRVRLLDSLRKSGAVVTLAWDVFSYQVIVAAFTADTRSVDPVPYRITCVVLQDNAAPRGDTVTALVAQVAADVASGDVGGALSVASLAVAVPIGAAVTAVAAPGATTLGTSAYNAGLSAMASAGAAIGAALGTANNTLGQYGATLLGFSQPATMPASVPNLAAAVSGAASAGGDVANLTSAAGYFGRAGVNLQNASA